jgi:hypothetical protein
MKSVTFNADISEYFLQYLHGCQFKVHMKSKSEAWTQYFSTSTIQGGK